MDGIRLDPAIAWLLRASLASLFAFAAFHKLRDPRAFFETLANHEILPRPLTHPAGGLVIMAEILVFVGLIGGFEGRRTGLAALALLTLYTFALTINLVRGRRQIDCGCLGPGHRQELSPWMVGRNVVLALAAGALCLPVADRPLVFVDGITLLGGFLALSLLFQAAIQLATQPRPARHGADPT